MGQYYKPIILEEGRKTPVCYGYSHHCDNGLKLMEHSYIGNNFVNAVINYIKSNDGANLVWAGDYADNEPDTVTEGNPDGINLYCMCDDDEVKEMSYDENDPDIRFIVNEDKHEYVDLYKVPGAGSLRVHPLPLLTCEGNGRGGGDYYGLDMAYVGRWARDFIYVKKHSWDALDKLKEDGFTEIRPMFVEMSMVGEALSEIKDIINHAVETGELDPKDNAWYMKDIRESLKDISNLLKPRKKSTAKK